METFCEEKVVCKLSSDDTDKIIIFKNPYTGKNYSFQILDRRCEMLSDDVTAKYHYKPTLYVEQIWYKITPDIDGNYHCVAHDYELVDFMDGTTDGPTAVFVTLDSNKNYGENVRTASLIKKNADDKFNWKLVLFNYD